MKAYEFRFKSVLKSKKIIVDDLSSKTARAQRILLLEMRKLGDMKERETQCVRELTRRQIGRVDTAEVQRSHRYLELLWSAIAEQSKKVQEIGRRVEMLRNMLVEAEKQKKTFEKLNEKEREEFYREFLKKEQALLDEIGANRFSQRTAHRRIYSPG
jgi:flagellar export protein FliJ